MGFSLVLRIPEKKDIDVHRFIMKFLHLLRLYKILNQFVT